MSSVTNTTTLSQVTKNVKTVLESEVGISITDPQASSRTTATEFIRTTWARKQRLYPHVVVESFIGEAETLSLVGDALIVSVYVILYVVTKDMKTLDELTSQVIDVMRKKRSIFAGYGMRRPKDFLHDVSGVITDTREQTHMRTATFEFIYFMR